MAEFKEGMKKHVSAAREWLGKAERSFDQENDVRGDLSLMLAQAELQHAKEAKQSGKKRRTALGELLFRMAAVAGIVGLAAIAWGIRPEFFRTPSVPAVKSEMQSAPSRKETHVAEPNLEAMPEVSSGSVEPLPLAAEAKPSAKAAELPAAQVETTAPKVQKQDVEVTPEQFRQLMRAAGKSLRGD